MDVNKKILWISDYELDQAPGGAQRSDKILIDKGKLNGLNILKVNFQSLSKIDSLDNFDIVISSNIARIYYTYPGIVDKISNHKHHVRIEHDSNEYLSAKDREKLFSSCKKTFFLSDYHISFFRESYGDFFKNVEIVLDPIDTKLFKNLETERGDEILYSGYMHEGKGTDSFFEYVLSNPDKNFVISGWCSSRIYQILSERLPNVKFLGRTEYEDMPNLYNRYKTMFYDPIVKEPFCRSVAESILCGMNIMTNKQKQIGCLHEINKLGIEEFKNQCTNAPEIFWNKI